MYKTKTGMSTLVISIIWMLISSSPFFFTQSSSMSIKPASNLRQPNSQRHLSTSVDHRCVDRSSVDGGICNEELGYGVVDGVCEFIVGCGDMEDYFDNMSGCNWVCIRCDGAIGAEWNDDC